MAENYIFSHIPISLICITKFYHDQEMRIRQIVKNEESGSSHNNMTQQQNIFINYFQNPGTFYTYHCLFTSQIWFHSTYLHKSQCQFRYSGLEHNHGYWLTFYTSVENLLWIWCIIDEPIPGYDLTDYGEIGAYPLSLVLKDYFTEIIGTLQTAM